MSEAQAEYIEYMPLDELLRHPRNPKHHDLEGIGASINEHGVVAPPIIDERSGLLAVGHGRLDSLQKRKEAGQPPPKRVREQDGRWFVPVVRGVSFDSEEDLLAYVVADNQLTIKGGWDDDLLAEVAGQVFHFDEQLARTMGFTDQELRALTNQTGGRNSAEDPGAQVDKAEALQETWGVQSGDLWLIPSVSQPGRFHKLLCGDSTLENDVDRLLADVSPSLCFTSPPYNVGPAAALLTSHGKETTKYHQVDDDDTRSLEDYGALLDGFTEEALKHCHTLIVNLQSLAQNKLALIDYLYRWRLHFADVAIWSKLNAQPAMAEGVMTSAFEFLYFFAPEELPTRSIPTATYERGLVRNVYSGGANIADANKDLHAASMPLHLAEWALTNFSAPFSLVFDPFMGTGTTMVASERLGRLCAGIEIAPLYCAVALQRFKEMDLEPERAK